jgi:glutaconyl-CoA/methylmalonyl-CoA decarboxylase subunit gamma
MGRALRYTVTVRGREFEVEVASLPDGRYRVTLPNSRKPVDVTLLDGDRERFAAVGQKIFEVRPNGSDVSIGSERRPVRVESSERRALGRGASSAATSGTIRAPMPGRVVKVLVQPGDTIEKGAGVVVVEAMKMENELFATLSGIVERVTVRAGDAVERGAPLVEIR